MLNRNAVGASHNSLHIWRAGRRSERPAHRGRRGRGLPPLLALSAAERDCDGRPPESRAKLTCSVTSGSLSLSRLLQRGPRDEAGGGAGASAEGHPLRLPHSDRREVGKEQRRRRSQKVRWERTSTSSRREGAGGGANRSEVRAPAPAADTDSLSTLGVRACAHTSDWVVAMERQPDASVRLVSVDFKGTAM